MTVAVAVNLLHINGTEYVGELRPKWMGEIQWSGGAVPLKCLASRGLKLFTEHEWWVCSDQCLQSIGSVGSATGGVVEGV